MAFYHRPNKFTQWLNRALSWIAALGLTPADTVTVEVEGRKSGKIRANTVTWVQADSHRYLVSPRGESEWVRNVRAAGGEAAIRHRGRQRVRLEEVAVDERAAIIKAYLAKTKIATRQHFGVDPEAGLSEFEAIASRHPVFRIIEL